ncbi:hypothetical protein AMTRI_Chr05g67260 [Amborella trichopoda]
MQSTLMLNTSPRAQVLLRQTLCLQNGLRFISSTLSFRERPRRVLNSRERNREITIQDLHKSCEEGHMRVAVKILGILGKQGIRPDYGTYAKLLNRCISMKALSEGKAIHHHMLSSAIKLDVHFRNLLITMYSKCGFFNGAQRVFEKMPEKNVISWTSVISGLAQSGKRNQALDHFCLMRREGVRPNETTFATVMGLCSLMERLDFGMSLHCLSVKYGLFLDVFIGSGIIVLYTRCGFIQNAQKVFDEMPVRDVVSWNAMISGFSQNGFHKEAISMLSQMLLSDTQLNNFTVASVLKACGGIGFHIIGESIHGCIVKLGFDWDVFVCGSLIDMYAKCSFLEEARVVFDTMDFRDLVSWNTMITGYAQNDLGEEALELFSRLQIEGFVPNQFTYASIFKALAGIGDGHGYGRCFHAQVIKAGWLSSDVFVGTALVDMYAKSSDIIDAHRVFEEMRKRNLVSCNTLITGYSLTGSYKEAIGVYCKLRREPMRPDPFTFTGLLSSCSMSKAIVDGVQIHDHVIKFGFDSHVSVGNSLVDLYSKCGQMENASKAYRSIATPNAISWAAIISGFSQNGQEENALKLFREMHQLSQDPDEFIFTSVLKASASCAAMEQGKHIHAYVIKLGLESTVFVGSALVDMYSKCGKLEYSCKVFERMPEKNVVSWNAIIMGYAQHGLGQRSLRIFEEMQHLNVKPTSITFIGILFACSHIGLVDKGWQYFNLMTNYYGITPTIEHYTCMVDLLGRAGYLDESEAFLENSPYKSEAAIWRSLLASCRIHGNIEVGVRAANHCMALEPDESSNYVLLSNIYASKKMWGDAAFIRSLMAERGIEKEPGCSWIEAQDKVHVFVSEDRAHPLKEKIFEKLDNLVTQMKLAGYVPDTSFVLHDVDEKQKEYRLLHHSEKMAVAFGLMSTPCGTPIRIVKNLRVCGDCHNALKYVSLVTEREIIVRDTNRFHHFKNGVCSCGDYW